MFDSQGYNKMSLHNSIKPNLSSSRAFTLIEIIIVVALIAFIYVIAVPNFSAKSEVEIMQNVARFSSDIKSAFDQTVLTGKPHRLAIKLVTGEYWLESTEERNFYLKQEKVRSDQEDPESVKQEFEAKFQRYEEVAGEKVKDPKSDKEIPPTSPVLQAKNKLRGPKWSKVENLEWKNRRITETLIIKSAQMEHHESPITVENDTHDDLIVYLYIFPQGYIENATFHIYYRKEKAEIDVDKPPFTVVTKPYRGEALVSSGISENDVHASSNEEEEI